MVLAWGARGHRRWLTWIFILYLTLTIVATLGTGQHYFVDLIPSPAVAIAALAICGRNASRSRWMIFSGTVAVAIAWIVVVRLGVLLELSSFSVWILTALTLLVSGLALYLHSAQKLLPLQMPEPVRTSIRAAGD
jgi:hypothetical protein